MAEKICTRPGRSPRLATISATRSSLRKFFLRMNSISSPFSRAMFFAFSLISSRMGEAHCLKSKILMPDRKKKDEADWQALPKKPRYKIKTRKRCRPENVRQQVVKRRKFKKIQTEAEHFCHFTYRPGKCKKTYRMIVLRKRLKVVKGEMNLFDDVRHFFYITNDWNRSTAEMIQFYRNRADHENDIDQLKNGVKALAPASDSLLSNWALMAIASMAWDLQAWFGLLLPYRPLGCSIVRMEFKRFLDTFIRIPCLIIRTGRRICYRLVGYNDKLKHVIRFSEAIKTFSSA